MINIHFEDTEILDLDPEFFVLWLSKVCQKEGFDLVELNLIFCSDRYLHAMNRKHLNHDYYTDIITFDYVEDKNVMGDLFISVDRVLENAQERELTFKEELDRVVVHGLLHLLGYKDKSKEEKVEMRGKENEYLSFT